MNLEGYIGFYHRLSPEDGVPWLDVLSRFGGAIASSFEDTKSSPIARFAAFMGDSLGPYGVDVDKLPAGSVAITGPGVVYNLGAGIACGNLSIKSREGIAANNPDWCKIPIKKADAQVPWIVQDAGALYELQKNGRPSSRFCRSIWLFPPCLTGDTSFTRRCIFTHCY
jgi:hypothetical protein